MRTDHHESHGRLVILAAVLVVAVASVALLSIHSVEKAEVAATPVRDDVPDALARGRLVPDRLLVKFEARTSKGVVDAVLGRAKVDLESVMTQTGVHVVRVSPSRRAAALAILESSPRVEYAERDVRLRALDTIPNDSEWAGQWGPRRVSAPRAWDVTRGSENVVIAVLDTGVDFSHPDLTGAFVAGYDFVNDDPDAGDDHGHGTATAGVAAARTNNANGVAGACWTCSLMPVKVLGSDAYGDSSTVARGIVWAVDHGARVVNLSLGGPETTQTLTDAVAYATARGALLVAAAGNDGTSAPYYPAASPAVIGVAAVDELDEPYGWSNHGPWVHVAAPGCNLAPLPAGVYGEYCGTSSAAPLVAGLAGLALSYAPGATSADLERAIERASEPTAMDVRHGRVDAAAMLSSLGAPSAPMLSSLRARGRLTTRRPQWARTLTVDSGTIVATLTSRPADRLTLSIVDRAGRTIRRAAGAAPLRAAIPAGTYRLVVAGRGQRSASFTLRVSWSGR
jgi:subtilisin family serine protease